MKKTRTNYLFICLFLGLANFQGLMAQNYLKPPDNLIMENVPTVPAETALQLRKYVTKTSNKFHGWSEKDGSLIGYSNYGKPIFLQSPHGLPQKFDVVLSSPDYFEFQPKIENSLIFAKRNQNNENSQLFQFDVDSSKLRQLSEIPDDENVGSFCWTKDGTGIYFSDQRKKDDKTNIYFVDNTTKKATLFTTLDDEYFYLVDINKDYLILKGYLPNNQAYYSLLNLKTLEMKPFTEKDAKGKNASFSKVSQGIWFLNNKEKKFYDVYYYDLSTQRTKKVNNLEMNISNYSLSPDEKILAVIVNENGANSLRLFELNEQNFVKELPKPQLSAGIINSISWRNNEELGFDFESTQTPPEIRSYNIKTNVYTIWTTSNFNPDIINKLEEAKLINWKSFDNKEITGFLLQPKQNDKAVKFPVIIDIHGGLNSQFQPAFDAYTSFMAAELPAAIIFPNIRGSSGFGKDFEDSDNKEKREDSIKDLQALLDWIGTQPQLDSERIFLRGESYGGFVAFALGLKEQKRIKAIIAEFPLMSIKSDILNLSGNIREIQEGVFGSLSNEKLINQLEKMSLVGNDLKVWNIPTYFVNGKNDNLTVTADVRKVKNQLKELKKDFWYLEGENESHGFYHYENYFFLQASEFEFYKKYLNK